MIDYLPKPVEGDDLVKAVKKIKDDIRKNENPVNVQLLQLEKLLSQNSVAPESKIGIGMADKIVFVNIPDIIYCEATGSYTNVYLQAGKKMLASNGIV